MRAKCTSLKLDLPFIFHAGETLDHGGDTDSNLYDAILLGAKRIGHGFSITKHPLLMQMCKERGIAIETCPISNEALGLCATVKSHHLPTLMANGVPCSISSDDPGCWDATVLSHDFYQTLIGSNYMTLLGWRIVAQWSIHYSCIKAEAREDVEKDFEDRWQRFCQWIVDEFGARAADVGSP
jgi:adenosine deaminase CECR1